MSKLSVAYVVNVMLPDDSPATLEITTEDITNALEASGLIVAAVAPYDRASLEGLDLGIGGKITPTPGI